MLFVVLLAIALVIAGAIVALLTRRLARDAARALEQVRADGSIAYVTGAEHAMRPSLVSRRGDVLTLWSVGAGGTAEPVGDLDAGRARIVPARVRVAALRWARGVEISDAEDPDRPALRLAFYDERRPLLKTLGETELRSAIDVLTAR